jgi:hypothetical protein
VSYSILLKHKYIFVIIGFTISSISGFIVYETELPLIFKEQTGFIPREDVIKIASSNAWDKSQPTFVLLKYNKQFMFNEFHMLNFTSYEADPYSKEPTSNGKIVNIICESSCSSSNSTNRFAWNITYADSTTRCYQPHYIDAITGKVIGYEPLHICN